MAAGLRAFLRAARERRFEWGRHDCLLFCADWVARHTGRDLAAPWRGTYASEREARALIRRHGGMVSLIDLASFGHLLRTPPEASLIAVISADGDATGVIRAGAHWAGLSPDGTAMLNRDAVRCLAAWGVE